MSSSSDHYAQLLAPIYTWMVGGVEAALALGQADLAGIGQGHGLLAVDLGAGFGMHTIPLAKAGWQVLAVDSSAELLAELAALAKDLQVAARCADLMDFDQHLAPGLKADLVLCMGDTLTHLDSRRSVAELCRRIASKLAAGGRFVTTFRDYTRPPTGVSRFIPVRADDGRILTCFLEESGEHVQVHDLLHERVANQWKTQVSSYRKLRLGPEELCQLLQAVGLRCELDAGPRGMVRVAAYA